MATPPVLNPSLYRALVGWLKRVQIGNPGVALREPMTAHYNSITGVPRHSYPTYVEHYRVRCPYCKDHRPRLSIAYFWGQLNTDNRPMEFPACCFNEQCLDDETNKQHFREQLTMCGTFSSAPVFDKASKNRLVTGVSLPGTCTRVDALPSDNEGVAYLSRNRGFDVFELAKKYDIRVCTKTDMWGVEGRIVCPVYLRGKLVGWQARYPADVNWKREGIIKYRTMTGMPTSQVLYNFDRARHWHTIILVEGVSDVWSVGSCAVASFGKSLSPVHIKLLHRANPAAVVLLYDPEERNSQKTKEVEATLRAAFGSRTVSVWLPAGTDPGSTDRDIVRAYVKREAALQGVDVQYRIKTDEPSAIDTEPADVAAELARYATAGA